MPTPSAGSVSFTADTAPLNQEQLDQQLGVAVCRNHHDGIRRLVAAGANVAAMHQEKPLLHIAAMHVPQVVDLLLELGADVNQPDASGKTMLAKSLDHEVAGLLSARFWLERGADPCHPSSRFGLHAAAFLADLDMVELLLAHGANASWRNGRGQTPEDIAAQRPNPSAAAVSTRLREARIEQEKLALHEVMESLPPSERSDAPPPRARL